ncbi:TonB-dependent siderophore receptor [Burkholderia cepacia]|uniref:TonB-dependent siderophore receptor n=1 Tax=Burkholderia cepacia TaxID=292 RepID=UPI00158C2B81|nr:TonB-dependent receptor [Burkholderia cepacia]
MSTASTPAVQTLFALCVAAWNTGVLAAPESTISLPQQSLEKSLAQLSRETGVGILAPGDLVANRTVGPVSGHFSVSEALSRLLQGTGLLAEKQDEKTWVIRGASPPKPVPAAPRNDGSTVLPDINVTAGKEPSSDGFVAYSTSSATRSDTPLSDLAQSVQVVTQDVMKSQQAQNVKDALSNVSSVAIDGSGSGTIYIRGFAANVITDGFSGIQTGPLSPGPSLNLPATALESVEVLKGADSILSGAMQPGGVVNIVKKRPQAERVRELSVQTGSYGDWQTSLDMADALTDNKKLTYRFVISGQRAGQDFLGRDGKRDFYVAPSVGWKSGGTSLIVGMEQHTVRFPVPPFTFLTPSGPIPLNSAIGSPGDHLSVNDTGFYYDFEQKFNDGLTFHSKARHDAISANSALHLVTPPRVVAGAYRTNYYWDAASGHTFSTYTDNNLRAKFRTGAIRHELLAGWSYAMMRYATEPILSLRSVSGPVPTSQLPGPSAPYLTSKQAVHYYSSVAYVQDQLAWGPLHLLASVSRNQSWLDRATHDQTSAWTPNFGLLWQITENVGLYGNLLRSFSPQSGTILTGGSIAPPSLGRSFEVGLKLSALDDRLTGSIAAFRNAVTNQTFSDPNNPGFSILSAGSVSRGIELDLTGRILPGWNIIASYTYTSMRDVSSQTSISKLPRHAASLWTTYDLQGESFRGWGGGIGIQARSAYDGFTSAGTYRMGGQTRTDASVYYHSKRWSATLGVKNVFNRTLYGNYAVTTFTEIEPTRLFYLTANYNF